MTPVKCCTLFVSAYHAVYYVATVNGVIITYPASLYVL